MTSDPHARGRQRAPRPHRCQTDTQRETLVSNPPNATTATKPSWQHQTLVRLLRLTGAKKPLAGNRVHETVAKLTAKPRPSAPAKWMVRGATVELSDHRGWPLYTLRPTSTDSGKIVVAIHGGAYVGEISWTHWLSFSSIVRETGATVVVPIYPLAPKGTAASVIPHVADLFEEIVTEHGADSVGVVGDSAGAGLALAAMQELVTRGTPTPVGLVLISPWLDVTMSDKTGHTIDDPMLDSAGLASCGRLWAGDLDPDDPRVSPLFGSLAGLPPTTVYAGSLDLLYSDALRLQERAATEGANISFVLREGLLHVWAGLGFLPESRAVRPQMHHQLTGPHQ